MSVSDQRAGGQTAESTISEPEVAAVCKEPAVSHEAALLLVNRLRAAGWFVPVLPTPVIEDGVVTMAAVHDPHTFRVVARVVYRRV